MFVMQTVKVEIILPFRKSDSAILSFVSLLNEGIVLKERIRSFTC